MFHSNQRISFDGDNDKDLKIVMETVLKIYTGDRFNSNKTEIKAFKIDERGRLVFGTKPEAEGFTAYPMDISIGLAIELIKGYLTQANPNDFMMEPSGDGSLCKGWHICMPECKCSDDWFYAIIAVEPCYTFYHK